jgi:c-di-AMP phosphodiesterase-like protein
MKQDYSVKDILNAVDDILKVKPIQESARKIINEVSAKNEGPKKLINNMESKKENKMKKKYDLLVVNNAKDILILNRIIFK